MIETSKAGVGEEELTIIAVEGELVLGDEEVFANAAIGVRDALVLFSSPGGNVFAGIEIGKIIRIKGFATAVPDGFVCASACALSWLAGRLRFMGPGRAVGFHAAWRDDDAQQRPDAVGNAVVGAYLNSLGLPTAAIAYVVEAKPAEMRWLTFADAERIGVEVQVSAADEKPRAEPAETEWIQIFSRDDLLEAKRLAEAYGATLGDVAVFRYDNGWFVVVHGPFREGTAAANRDRLVRRGAIPDDSLVTAGQRFQERVWASGKQIATEPAASEWEDLAKAAVERFFRAWSEPQKDGLALLRDIYPSQFRYFGKIRSKTDVLAEKARLMERWPIRSYIPRPQTINVSCRYGGVCAASGTYDWIARNPASGMSSSGTATFSFEFAVGREVFMTSEDGAVKSRTVSKGR